MDENSVGISYIAPCMTRRPSLNTTSYKIGLLIAFLNKMVISPIKISDLALDILMSRFWIGVILAAIASASHAAMTTEQFSFALPSATGIYKAGHVFTITTAYNKASTVMHTWNDGYDGKADFGANDDTPSVTYNLSDPSSRNWSFFSDAAISVGGLLLPAGATPNNVYTSNYSITYEYLDAVADGDFVLQLLDDDTYIALEFFGPTAQHPYAGNLFFQLEQHYIDSNDNPQQFNITQLLPASSVQRATLSQVPEPSTLALLCLGALSMTAMRRRKK